MAKAKKNRTDLAAERYSIPADGAHAADTLINVLFDDLEPQDKLSLLWMGMGMAQCCPGVYRQQVAGCCNHRG